jgi:hypothetical protein
MFFFESKLHKKMCHQVVFCGIALGDCKQVIVASGLSRIMTGNAAGVRGIKAACHVK